MGWSKNHPNCKPIYKFIKLMGGRKKYPNCILLFERGRGKDGICRSLLL
jgi:hypothetical protein